MVTSARLSRIGVVVPQLIGAHRQSTGEVESLRLWADLTRMANRLAIYCAEHGAPPPFTPHQTNVWRATADQKGRFPLASAVVVRPFCRGGHPR
jgi:hypothetical protein